MPTHEKVWIAIGVVGQSLFFLRFFVQWVSSERAKRSVIPISFWYFSLSGGAVVLAYAIYRRDPVFILGQTTGVFIYLRNLYLVYRERRAASPSSPGGVAGAEAEQNALSSTS
jgi:lipid-A-disaccharide synthase-like uncharacterized protein